MDVIRDIMATIAAGLLAYKTILEIRQMKKRSSDEER
ncbi:hypothetical protein J2S00_003086 [Caldalkalibacillus uzonensis]|uniref:Uncharacterized protein n=1 Tax=Caldalkalibacillus uzonensis TaxID=353224 RepID=A0ABU0CV29_9BACI|nr:hypothetical protein [Caldalkalibacillus uzonensis]